VVAADEAPALQEPRVEGLERLGERGLGILGRLRLGLVVGVGRADLTRVLGEAQRRIRRAREQRIERPGQVVHRAVDHRPLARIGRVEAVEPVAVAEVAHDRAALPQRAARQSLLLEQRRQVRRVLGQELRRGRLAPHVGLVEVQPGGAHEDAHRQVVHRRRQDAERVCGHEVLL
jgi:hypothetical protein